MSFESEYAITLSSETPKEIADYLIKRIEETGLECRFEFIADQQFKCIHIRTNKAWLLAHRRETDIYDANEDIRKLPKFAIMPSALAKDIIYTTIEELTVDDTFKKIIAKNKNSNQKQTEKLWMVNNLLYICQRVGIIDDIFPLPDFISAEPQKTEQKTETETETEEEAVPVPIDEMAQKNKLWKNFFSIRSLTRFDQTPSLDKIRDYFGEEIAFYFAFMDHYIKWLGLPSIVASALVIGFTTVHTLVSHEEDEDGTVVTRTFDAKDNSLMPLFSIFMCVWAHCMIKFWNRRSSSLALRWKTIERRDQQSGSEGESELIRPEFEGEMRKSLITGEMEGYYSAYKRYPKFVVAFVISLLMLCLAFAFMICSLNMQGYIHFRKEKLHIKFFRKLSKPGHIFDANSDFMWMGPVLMHTTVIFTLNSVYSNVAQRLTEWENWKYEKDFENSLILKRFVFEFLDAYLPLFYICFYQMDADVLATELYALYVCDEFRRISTETVMPLVVRLIFVDPKLKQNKKSAANIVLMESRLNKYELFDDYLEMLTQFGYISLFASAYPLGALLALVSNLLEVWSDSFKLCFLCQRPNVKRTANIHSTWIFVLKFMAWFSIFTNCFIFAFTSDQLEEWFPQFFKSGNKAPEEGSFRSQGFKTMKKGKQKWVLFIMFGLEHFLGALAIFIQYCISDVPETVSQTLKRKQYLLKQEHKQRRVSSANLFNNTD